MRSVFRKLKTRLGREARLCLLLTLAALALRILGVQFGLPDTYHMDERTIVERALAFGTGDLNPHAAGRPAHIHMYVLFFFDGLIYLGGRLVGAFRGPEEFAQWFWDVPTLIYMVGRCYSAILGALTIPLVYLIGRRIHSPKFGLVAAVLLCVNFSHVVGAHYVTVAAASAFFLCCSVLFTLRIVDGGGTRDGVWAGVFLGLAMAERYSMGIGAFPIAAAVFLAPGDGRARFLDWIRWRRLFVAGVCAFAAFAVVSPFVLLDFGNAWAHFASDAAITKEPSMRAGLEGAPVAHAILRLIPEGMGWATVFLVVSIATIPLFFRSRAVGVILIYPILYFFAVIPGTYILFPRYITPLAPFFALAAAFGFFGLWTALRNRRFRIGLAILFAAICGYEAMRCASFDLWISKEDTRRTAREWIEDNVPKGAIVSLSVYHYSPQFESLIDHLAYAAQHQSLLWGSDTADAHSEWKSGIFEMLKSRTRSESDYEIRYYTSSGVSPEESLFNGEEQYVVVSSFARDRYYSVAARQFGIGASGRHLYDRIAGEGERFVAILPPESGMLFDFSEMRERYSHPKIEIYRLRGTLEPSPEEGSKDFRLVND